MLDHITLHVNDFAKSKDFYIQALKPLGYTMGMEFDFEGIGYGGLEQEGKPDFWLKSDGVKQEQHLAFMARNREEVDGFYAAALSAGAKDNGPPGIREDYAPNYYAAYILDPDGHNIEAVYHE